MTPCACIAESIGLLNITTSPWSRTTDVVARGRVSNDAAGLAQLWTPAEAGDSAEHAIAVAAGTHLGLWLAALQATAWVTNAHRAAPRRLRSAKERELCCTAAELQVALRAGPFWCH